MIAEQTHNSPPYRGNATITQGLASSTILQWLCIVNHFTWCTTSLPSDVSDVSSHVQCGAWQCIVDSEASQKLVCGETCDFLWPPMLLPILTVHMYTYMYTYSHTSHCVYGRREARLRYHVWKHTGCWLSPPLPLTLPLSLSLSPPSVKSYEYSYLGYCT